jgi:hypothetical protein
MASPGAQLLFVHLFFALLFAVRFSQFFRSLKPVAIPHHGGPFPDRAPGRDIIEVALVLTRMVQRAKP